MMPKRDIFVIGASAGGVDALQQFASQLPRGFPGAVFIVLHISPRTKSLLPELLSRTGCLPAVHPEDGERIDHRRIYVAPPDRHLVIQREHVHLSAGPREQHHRPCINVLFRSAALAYGERVVGTVLTGELDDGTAGLWEVKRRGGIAVVQNPERAAFPSMALSALREIEADYVAELGEIGALFLRLAAGEEKRKRTEIEGVEVESQITDLTCPDCRGTIWEVRRGKAKEYRCRVGHTFSTRTMFSEQSATQEEGIYSAIVALEEGASLASRIADEFEPAVGKRLRAEAKEREAQAEAIRRILKQRASFSLD